MPRCRRRAERRKKEEQDCSYGENQDKICPKPNGEDACGQFKDSAV